MTLGLTPVNPQPKCSENITMNANLVRNINNRIQYPVPHPNPHQIEMPIRPMPTGRGDIRRVIQFILHRIIALRMLPPPPPPRSPRNRPLSPRQRSMYYHRQILQQAIEVEGILYKSARSTEEYQDRESLEMRVWDACQRRARMMQQERERDRERLQLHAEQQQDVQNDSLSRQQQLLPPIIHDPERAQRHRLVQGMIREQMAREAAMMRLVLEQGRARMEGRERSASGRGVWKRTSGGRLVRNA
ncbi:hypothetical protein ACHAXS_004377 [Conticribra weissflogii]